MSPLSGLPRRIRASTVGTHLWALLDQGAVSLGSALTSILLARYLSSDAFGMAVLLIAGMLFLNTIHASLIVYPLSVHGARLRGISARDYAGVALSSTLSLAVPLAFVLAVAAVFVSGRAVWVAALTLLAWQVQETTRRALFAQLRHRAALVGDILSYLGQAAVISMLGMAGALTLSRVFMVMALTSTVAIVVQAFQLAPIFRGPRSSLRPAIDLLRSGRPALASNLLGAAIMQSPIWMLGLLVDHDAAGSFQAMVAVVGVMNPVMYGVANALMPAVAQRIVSQSTSLVSHTVTPAMLASAGLVLPYLLALWAWPTQILGVVYGNGSIYVSLAPPLRVLAVAYLLVLLAHIANAALFGLDRPGDVRAIQVAGALILLIAGVPVVSLWGLWGAVAVVTAAHGVRCLMCIRALDRFARSPAWRPAVIVGQK